MSIAAHVSVALARAADQGSWISAQATLKSLDPLLRIFARRHLRKSLERARRETTLDDPAHVLRVAALLASGSRPANLDLDDPAQVQGALAASVTGEVPKQRPWPTLALLAGVAGVVTLALIVPRWLRPFDARQTPIGEVLGEGLTAVVTALAAPGQTRRLAEARAKASGEPARRALGDDGAKRLARVLDAAEGTARARGNAVPDARSAFLAAADDFSLFLAQQKLPFFVDAEVLTYGERAKPVLMSSYVEREIELEAEGKRVRAVHLWRLDRVGMFGVLGYTRPRTPVALVLLDQVETDLVRWVLPALPPGERMEVVDEETAIRDEAWAVEVELRAAEILRRHYAPLLDAETARVGRVLARRRALIRKWRASLSGQGIVLRIPDRLIPEADYASDLEIRITRPNLREWDEIHAELLSPPTLAAFAKLRDRYTLSIERHETQHRLDFMRGFLPLPAIAARFAGVEDPLDLPEGSLGASTRNELSAYLAQLAQAPDSPLLELVLMVRLALSKATLGGAHSLAALCALLEVGRELGIDPEPYFENGITRPRMAELLVRVAGEPPDAIRAAAARAYRSSFGQELAVTKRRSVREGTAWRH